MSRNRALFLVMPILLALAGLGWLAWLLPAEAIPTTACEVPGDDHLTIQSAVDDPGCETVNLGGWRYIENVTISRSLTIRGEGMAVTTVDGDYNGSVFSIGSGVAVTLADMAIVHGAALYGGGVYVEDSFLSLENVMVSDNAAANVNGYETGGGLYNENGQVIISASRFISNSAQQRGGGIYNKGVMTITDSMIISNTGSGGGGVTNFGGVLHMSHSTLSGNSAAIGGGLYIWGGEITIANSELNDNIGDQLGGGAIFNSGASLTITDTVLAGNFGAWGGAIRADNHSTTSITGSTLRDNRADGLGGATAGGASTIYILDSSSVHHNSSGQGGGGIATDVGALTVINSTISNNTSQTSGGGIFKGPRPGTAQIINSTVADNTAKEGSGIFVDVGYTQPEVTLLNSIVANNHGSENCGGPTLVNSAGFNLASDESCNLVAASDIVAVNPGLDSLGDNGGATLAHALLPGSPALDNADGAACAATDQLGVSRPQGAGCDIGALEATLMIGKEGPALVWPGRLFTYTIEVGNGTLSPLSNLVISDVLPGEANYVSGGTLVGNTVSWVVPALQPQSVITRHIVVTASKSLTNSTYYATTTEGHQASGSRAVATIIRSYAYLPTLLRNYCGGYFDDFSNPSSGWFVGEDEFVRSEYLSGEFRILTKRSGYFFLYASPGCRLQAYSVETDARWVGALGNSYGLLFGISPGFEQYYLFDVNSEFQMFRLLRRAPGGFVTIAPPTFSPAINIGASSNHLKAIRIGDRIWLEINGVAIGSYWDNTIGGSTGTGLVASASSAHPSVDARFDNFELQNLQYASGPNGLDIRAASQSDWIVVIDPAAQFAERNFVRQPLGGLAYPW